MKHLNDGEVRRLVDEPGAGGGEHLAGCADCTRAVATARRDAIAAATVVALDPAELESINVGAALTRVRLHAHTHRAAHPATAWAWFAGLAAGSRTARHRRTLPRLVTAAVAIAVVASALAVSGGVSALTEVFHPTRVTTIPVAAHPVDLQGLPDLGDYGSMTYPSLPPSFMQAGAKGLDPTPGSAEAVSGLRALAALPGIQGPASFAGIGSQSASFKFDAAKARSAAAAAGRPAPVIPAGLDGASLRVTAGPALLQVYGSLPDFTSKDTSLADLAIPTFVLQSHAPTVSTSNGMTIREMEALLVAQPGISPALAAQVRAIGDPGTSLPIPLPAGVASGEPITVHGTAGEYVFSEQAKGLLAAVVWQQGDIVYAVGGHFAKAALIALANQLNTTPVSPVGG